MTTSNIWLIPGGSFHGQPHDEIPLIALWSSKFSRNVVHESAVRHLSLQKSDCLEVGILKVKACFQARYSEGNDPEIKWSSRAAKFYVTSDTLPSGAKAIIALDQAGQSSSASMSDMAAPVHKAVLSQRAQREQDRREADARAQRERDSQKEAEKIAKKYKREQEQFQQQQWRRQDKEYN
ncbi:hypothetical protein LTR70_009915 [Exophiala xenobiotica]|uniref:Uncharacterized protein n=1 Tax=Lithohypha guttulata TaxID=1690604 RepID=A0ABR0JXV3_9EURO|nr:hypothetical protein LTR24_009789 [Lithohypha guttulata]KAK5309889.1 hypothetical protein LTR70_009915 [Exophiala xenobiotica]